ncbi:MAG TPA: PEP-CTERM sorting domain-containing protein [Phycisphaerae bacterium]|nr:PEP-CTERM sorting domain-containing protein [Phycisphaerae bacterium]HDZ45203.1 PEP-CTERM sorting domain-containing protein [Phycisphaerae bacterium]
MRTFAIALMAVTMVFAATAQAYAPSSASGKYGISTQVSAKWLGDGQWEYAYDIFGEGSANLWYDYLIMKFEFGDGGASTDHILNLYDPGAGPELREFWTVNGMIGNRGGHWFWGGVETGVQASYGDLATNTWITNPTSGQASGQRWLLDPVYAAAEGMANPFHDPLDYGRWAGNDYYTGQGDSAFGLIGGRAGEYDSDGIADDIFYDMTWFLGGHIYNATGPQLMATIRVVSDLGPYGAMQFQYYGSGSQRVGPVMAPGVTPDGLGDFDTDGDVDADDIDILCANMGGDPATYDLDGDGDVDIDDMIVLIETLAEWDNGVTSGVGTKRGDFNLDGVVDGIDLALMKTAFGEPDMGYADANANCDAFVDGTDLAILKTNFGFIAPTGGSAGLATGGAVPEPMTLLVMAAAGLPVLLKRKRKSQA